MERGIDWGNYIETGDDVRFAVKFISRGIVLIGIALGLLDWL